jgi:hypothetical protein
MAAGAGQFELHQEAERWVDTGLDMLRLSPSLRNEVKMCNCFKLCQQ